MTSDRVSIIEYVGPTAVRQGVFGRLVAEWDDFRVHPKEIVPTSDGALAQQFTDTAQFSNATAK